MNSKQKIVIIVAVAVIVLSLIVWIAYGGEIFTKYQVLVETQSELDKQLGVTQKEWKDQFIWGLDYSLFLSGIAVVGGGLLTFLLRTKNK